MRRYAIQFTKQGEPVDFPYDGSVRVAEFGEWLAYGAATDVHFEFRRGTAPPRLIFKDKDGNPIGDPVTAPEGAHDVGGDFEYGPPNGGYGPTVKALGSIFWTDANHQPLRDSAGNPIRVPAPKGAESWDLELNPPDAQGNRGTGGGFTKVYWTLRGERPEGHRRGEITPPKDADDAHVFDPPAPRFGLRSPDNERSFYAAMGLGLLSFLVLSFSASAWLAMLDRLDAGAATKSLTLVVLVLAFIAWLAALVSGYRIVNSVTWVRRTQREHYERSVSGEERG